MQFNRTAAATFEFGGGQSCSKNKTVLGLSFSTRQPDYLQHKQRTLSIPLSAEGPEPASAPGRQTLPSCREPRSSLWTRSRFAGHGHPGSKRKKEGGCGSRMGSYNALGVLQRLHVQKALSFYDLLVEAHVPLKMDVLDGDLIGIGG